MNRTTGPSRKATQNMRIFIFGMLVLVSIASYAKDDPLSICLRDAGGAAGRPSCWEKEAARSRAELGGLLTKLENKLNTCVIPLENYRPEEALVHLKKAQQAWLKFIQYECAYVDATFGPGSDAWYAGIQCEVKQYRERSKITRAKLEAVQEVKAMLRTDSPDSLRCP